MNRYSDKVVWAHIDYLYDPTFIYNKIITLFNDSVAEAKIKIRPIDNLAVPFTLKQIADFLESCASLMFFVQKNKVSKIPSLDGGNHTRITSDVYVKDVMGYNCLSSSLHFLPEGYSKGEITLDSELKELVECDEEDEKVRDKRRVSVLECVSGPYSLEEISTLKYYPRSVGYSEFSKEIKLEKFKLSKELKKEDYPLYVSMPYVQDYVNYCFNLPKDHNDTI